MTFESHMQHQQADIIIVGDFNFHWKNAKNAETLYERYDWKL